MISLYLKCIGMDDLAAQAQRLTKFQLVAFGTRVAALSLIPFTVIIFVGARALSSFTYFTSSLNKPPNVSFLRGQYDFLLTRGADQMSTALSLRMFEFLIWILIPIVLLRVILSPPLFGLVNWREKLQAAGVSLPRFLFGMFLIAAAIWASIDIRGSSSLPVVSLLMKQTPQTYIFLKHWYSLVDQSYLLRE